MVGEGWRAGDAQSGTGVGSAAANLDVLLEQPDPLGCRTIGRQTRCGMVEELMGGVSSIWRARICRQRRRQKRVLGRTCLGRNHPGRDIARVLAALLEYLRGSAHHQRTGENAAERTEAASPG